MNNPSITSSNSSKFGSRHTLAPDFALLATVGLWASTFIVTRDALDHFSGLAFIFIRFLLMLGLAFGVYIFTATRSGDGLSWPLRSDIPRMVLVGLSGYTCYQLGFVLSLERTTPFATALLIATSPLWTLALLTTLGERPPRLAWFGVAIAIAGVAIFLVDQRNREWSLSGNLLALGAALSFAIYGIVNRPLVSRYSASSYTAWTLLCGTVPLLIVSASAAADQDWSGLGTRPWLAIIYMVIFPVYIAYMLWNFGIARRGAAIASGYQLLVPVLAGVLSALFFDESFGAAKIAGAALVLLGLLVMRRGQLAVVVPPGQSTNQRG